MPSDVAGWAQYQSLNLESILKTPYCRSSGVFAFPKISTDAVSGDEVFGRLCNDLGSVQGVL